MKRLLFPFILASSCVLADSKYFEIKDVEVKQQSKDSLIAKQGALARAARSAFEQAIEAAEIKSLSIQSISDREIQGCVYDYSIEQEKFSESSYIGRFSYRFSKSKVAALLKSRGIVVDFGEGKHRSLRLAVYLKDFIRRASEFKKLKVDVEKFSNNRIVFKIEEERINDFRELGIKYAQLL